MLRAPWAALLVATALLALAGCTRSSSEAPSAPTPASARAPGSIPFRTPADTFVFAINGEPETLDPGRLRGVPETFIAINLFEGLVEYPRGEGEMVPGVAERWTRSPDGRTYTFSLRKDARWSNGDPVVAEDFRWSWLRVLDRKAASPYADQLYVIAGAEAYFTGAQSDPSTVGIRVVDPHTLVVELAYVAPWFLELAAFHTYRPVHRPTVEAFGDAWTRPEHMVSNGAFKLSAWVPNRHVELVRSTTYWDNANVALAGAKVLPIQDSSTMTNLYEGGELDWSGAVDLPSIQLSALARWSGFRQDPYLATYFYRFNVTRPPLGDNRVRRALSLAVDREAIERVLEGGHRAATTFVPPMQGWTSGDGRLSFDPDQARTLLAEAGFPEGRGFPRLTLEYNTQQDHKQVAEMVQQMWQRHLGVSIELKNLEWKVYLQSQTQLTFDLSRSAWVADYHDPMTFLGLFKTGNGNNNTGWGDKEYDALLDRANREGEPTARQALLREAESALLLRGPVLPIYHYGHPMLLNPAVEGFEANLLDLHPLKYLRKRSTDGATP
ncbi:MAG: peptide ABC transporter substrate-binding protein [Bradymonadia bacterium]